jgi:hypothetical protein
MLEKKARVYSKCESTHLDLDGTDEVHDVEKDV